MKLKNINRLSWEINFNRLIWEPNTKLAGEIKSLRDALYT